MIIDAHVHVLPDRLAALGGTAAAAPVAEFRRRARQWLKPVANSLHLAQTYLRVLPEPVRKPLDELNALVPIPSMIVESTPSDLREAMEEAGVDRALVIAHPPVVSNEIVLEACEENDALIPCVAIPSGTARPGQALKRYVQKGAKMLKIHPASDGEGVDSPRYKALLKAADELGLPVTIHTGCIHAHLFYKDPHQGQAQRFAPWFEAYKDIRFVLAHMNFHEPNVALDLCEEYPNLLVDTSWQPAETIGEAVRRIGASRVLFGTDWPFVGNNLATGLARIQDCVAAGTLNVEESKLILGENAAKLLGLTESAGVNGHAPGTDEAHL